MDVEIVEWEWKSDGRTDYGVIAQDIDPLFPKCTDYNEEKDKWVITLKPMIPVLIQTAQEQEKEINELKARLAKLEEKLNAL